ncbi:uncharacterized protein N7515_002196 [Penicillium bovifimosum]|uniref:DUF3669 domain-containing protein n=1 Tax=Penicillium bovifimosum TaxID=126998 RepID=A0A9W9HB75_9EURO|nr:uncharacterized protein N7515_002196 [Penicillium bovifimosum]KAJ5143409.1 hypothetical protein N7515_002196 [Penicillium bovifimosum]
MSSRRELNSSDESASSISRDARIARLYLEATELGLMPQSEILKRALSVESVISTTSSFSRRSQSARFRSELQKINQIGSGLQGAIFEVVGQALVLKKEYPGNETQSSNLRHEFLVHRAVSAAFDQYKHATHSLVHVPKPHEFISRTENHTFWDEVLPKMPPAYRTRGDVVKMDRILPLPKVVRKALITHIYSRDRNPDTADIETLLNEPENKHCLARIYLGQIIGPMNLDNAAPLRNFPLYLGFMEELGVNAVALANEMGKAYAILHWGAGINGDDVEFVLGTSAIDAPTALVEPPDLQRRAVGLYLLDFGQCEVLDLAQDCDVVYQAFKGAMVTAVHPALLKLFAAFKNGYIDAGNVVLWQKQLNDKFCMVDFMQEYEEYAEDFLY